jgi:hypothetical protein
MINKLSIVNVNWSEEVLTVTLEEKRPALTGDPAVDAENRRGWTRAEAMLLVDRLERFLASDPDILEAEVVLIEGKPTNIPLVTPREVIVAEIAPEQSELSTTIHHDEPPAPVTEDRQQKPTTASAPVQSEDNYKVDMGGHPATLLPPPPEPVSEEDREGELSVAFGVFEDSLREVRDVPSAVRIWLESQQLLTKHPTLRDRARLVMAGHLGSVLGVDAAAASEKMREALQARQKLMQGAGTPDPIPEPVAVAPVQQQTPAPVASTAPLNDQQKDFLAKLGSEQKQVMGTVVKVACQVVANPAKEVTPGLVESFLISMVGKHPLLTHDSAADEIRSLMQSTRFKLFALAAKTKIVEV